jgi:hypothetical protein
MGAVGIGKSMITHRWHQSQLAPVEGGYWHWIAND